jgi:hypothetical protein
MTSVVSTFKTHEPNLRDLLDEIHRGVIQLPDFQRGWVWDDDRIRALLAIEPTAASTSTPGRCSSASSTTRAAPATRRQRLSPRRARPEP